MQAVRSRQGAAQILDKLDGLDVHERTETYKNNNTWQSAGTGNITVEMQQEDKLNPPTDYLAVRSSIIAQVMDEEMRLRNERLPISESRVDIKQQSSEH